MYYDNNLLQIELLEICFQQTHVNDSILINLVKVYHLVVNNHVIARQDMESDKWIDMSKYISMWHFYVPYIHWNAK